MNTEPVALTQADILGILQDANSVPLGQPIFNSSEEYNKLKSIIESTIRYTHPAKTLTADDIHEAAKEFLKSYHTPELLIAVEDWYGFARAILRKAQDK